MQERIFALGLFFAVLLRGADRLCVEAQQDVLNTIAPGAGLSQIREERLRQLQKEAAERTSLQAQGRGALQDVSETCALVRQTYYRLVGTTVQAQVAHDHGPYSATATLQDDARVTDSTAVCHLAAEGSQASPTQSYANILNSDNAAATTIAIASLQVTARSPRNQHTTNMGVAAPIELGIACRLGRLWTSTWARWRTVT